MKIKDVYKDSPFHSEKLPIKTVQKKENQRPPKFHKFLKIAGKNFKKLSSRRPADVKERWTEKIPPYKGNQTSR